jgi:WD40 repeat protein
MCPYETTRVFISYSRKDGATLAQHLQSDLAKQGLDAWLDTEDLNAGRVWSTEVEREIDTRQVTVAVLTDGSYKSAICRGEQIRALRKGKRLIPVLGTQGADVPVYIEALHYRDFTNDSAYTASFGELLDDIRGDATATLPDTYGKTPVTYLTVPPRVANYVERPEALEALRDALFSEDHRQPIALTALAGMGGIGKTVLARALTEDEVVQRAFPDGIVWLTAGKERKRDFIEEMREVAKALGDDLSGYDTALACENQYRTTIAKKAALIVVDDVWSKSDVEALLAESPRSRFLFTTRDASIGRFVGANEHRADLLDAARSRELLALWAKVPLAELPATADEVIAECGRLPLALSVVGAMLRGADAEFWRDTLNLLRKADLSAMQEQLPPGQDSFFKAVEVSFQSLNPDMRERYRSLAVLLEDMVAPLPILETLWNVSEAEARRIGRHFVDRSLAQSEAATESIRLHDLQLDYVRARQSDQEALVLIHGAIRLSSHVIAPDPAQFGSQLIGRLLSYQDIPAIEEFAKRVAEGTRAAWLRPLQPMLHPPGTALIRTLIGHTGSVNAVAVTPDGQRAVSASHDKTLKVWDVATGRIIHTLKGHTKSVTGVALTADGRLGVSASADKTLKVWDMESGREAHTFTGHSEGVTGVVMTQSGRLAVSASADKTIKVWDVQSGRELNMLKGHTKAVNGVALTADGQLGVSASADKTLKVWDVQSGRELRTFEGHRYAVRGVAMTQRGRVAVSASLDKTLKVWDLETGRELRTLKGHIRPVYGVAMSEDARCAISASADHTMKVWDVENGFELRTLKGHTRAVYGVAVSERARHVISASRDKTLKVWDLESKREPSTRQGHTRRVIGVAVTGGRAVSASADKTLKVWDLGSGRELRTLTGHRYAVRSVAMTQNGRLIVSASSDKTLKVWDVESGRELRTLEGHADDIYGVAVSGDGRLAVSASADKTLKVWDLGSGRELRTLTGHRYAVRSVAMTQNGRLAVSASSDKTLKVWDVESGRELCSLPGHSGFVNGVAVSEDGRRAISGSWDETVKVWDVENASELRTLKGHAGWVYGVALRGDLRRAISASYDKTVKVWDMESGVALATFSCDSAACCCAFMDDHDVIAGDAGGGVHFLRLEEAKQEIGSVR